MKIKLENQLGLVFKKMSQMRDNIIAKHLEPSVIGLLSPEYTIQRKAVLDSILDDRKFKDFLITETVKEISSKIKVGAEFNYKLLNTIKEQASTYLLGKTRFMRFEVKNNNIYVLYVDFNYETSWLNYEMFRIDTKEGSLFGASDRSQPLAEELVKYLIFVNLSDVELMFLPPNKKIGNQKNGYKNDTKFDISIVDSSWNKFVIRMDTFGVSGHLRLQPHGKENKLRKLVWIEPYEKQSYVRKPKSTNA
jgi:hypothetical protein